MMKCSILSLIRGGEVNAGRTCLSLPTTLLPAATTRFEALATNVTVDSKSRNIDRQHHN